jgi:hypothetical protein
MYGGAVLTAYGVEDKPHKLWIGALSKLTPDEAKKGIAALAKQGRSYPPNLTEVLEACRPKKPGVRYLGRPVDMAAMRLPRPKASEEVRRKYVDHMKSVLGKAEPPKKREPYVAKACTCCSSGECETCRSFAELIGPV